MNPSRSSSNEADLRSSTPLDFEYPWDTDSEIQDIAIRALSSAVGDSATPSEDANVEGRSESGDRKPAATSRNSNAEHQRQQPEISLLPQEEDPLPDENPSKKREYEVHVSNGAVAPAPTVSRRKKKPKGMPKRPLSAYNIFFQQERIHVRAESDVVSFEDLGRTIGRRWKALSNRERKKYEGLAHQDSVRYRNEMEIFNQAKRKRNEMGAACSFAPPEEFSSSTSSSSANESSLMRSVNVSVGPPPAIKPLPYHPLSARARFPGQPPLPAYSNPEWPQQQQQPAGGTEQSSHHQFQFPVPPGTESK